MKKLIYLMLAVMPACFIIQGCDKLDDAAVTVDGQLKVFKTEVQINEPDSLLVINAKSSDKVSWNVSPSGFNTISSNGPAAVLIFSKAGSYKVTVTVNDGKPLVANIVVNTGVYTPPPGVPALLTGDQITISPSLYKSSKADTTYIILNAKTTNTYCANSRLNITSNVDAAGNYTANFINALPSGNCIGHTGPLQAGILFKQGPPLLAAGTYPLSMTLNGTNYTGTIVVSAASIVFNWSYTTGIVFTSKTIAR